MKKLLPVVVMVIALAIGGFWSTGVFATNDNATEVKEKGSHLTFTVNRLAMTSGALALSKLNTRLSMVYFVDVMPSDPANSVSDATWDNATFYIDMDGNEANQDFPKDPDEITIRCTTALSDNLTIMCIGR